MRANLLQLCPTLCDPIDCSPPDSSVHGDSPGKNTEVTCHDLLQGILPGQGLNPSLLCLLHCRQILYPLSRLGSPLLCMCVHTHTHTHTRMPHLFYSSFDGHLGCLPVLPIVNNAAMNIEVHVSIWITVFFEYMPKNGMAGSYANSTSSFLRNLHIVFHSGCTNLCSHELSRRVPCKHLLYIFFVGMKW